MPRQRDAVVSLGIAEALLDGVTDLPLIRAVPGVRADAGLPDKGINRHQVMKSFWAK